MKITVCMTWSGKRWSTNWDNNGPCNFHKASCDHCTQSDQEEERLEEQQHAMQGKESLHARQGEKLQTISHGNGTLLWEVHNCNFNLFLLKNWPCRLLNLIHCHKPWSFIGTWQWPNPCPGMCIYFSSKSEWNSYIVCALLCMTGQTQPTSCTHFFKYYGREKFEYNSAVSQHVVTAVPPFGSSRWFLF